jgi:hypothetical protein
MPASSQLVRRSGDLKGELVDFARGRRFARTFQQALEQRFGGLVVTDEGEFINFLDWFVLEHRLPSGRTVVEEFTAARPDLAEEERAMLLGWRDVVEGLFEVQLRDGEALVTVNLVDELPYRLRSNVGSGVFSQMPRGSFVLSRLVPVADEWLLSGATNVLPASSAAEARQAALQIAPRYPSLVFRNPERLARGWELQREQRRRFIDFFGSDLVVLPGQELTERMRAFGRFLMYQARDAEGRSVAERARQRYGSVPAVADLGYLPAELVEAATVGVIYDEMEGLHYLANFGLVQETFANPKLAADQEHRRAVVGCLKDASVPPLALRRLVDPDAERASRVLGEVLRRPGFSWERDGEALLRRYKASWFERPALPSVVPVGPALADPDQPAPRSRRRRQR